MVKMFDINKINLERIMKPSPRFSIFRPNREKLEFVADKLLNEYLYLSDEDRIPTKIWNMIFYYFPPTVDMPSTQFSLFYEIGNFDGLLGFKNILPEYKCSTSLKLWNPKAWGVELVRESRELFKFIMDEFKLKRIESETADKKIERMAHMAGFKTEGARRNAFRWKGKLFTLYMLGMNNK